MGLYAKLVCLVGVGSTVVEGVALHREPQSAQVGWHRAGCHNQLPQAWDTNWSSRLELSRSL